MQKQTNIQITTEMQYLQMKQTKHQLPTEVGTVG